MLVQGSKEIVCTGTSKTFPEVVETLLSEGDKFIDRWIDTETIHRVLEHIYKIYDGAKEYTVDSIALFVGNNHAHLITFYRGCHQYAMNMDVFNLLDIMNLLK